MGGVEGSGRRLECLWGVVGSVGRGEVSVAVLWEGAEECGSDGALGLLFACCLLPAAC